MRRTILPTILLGFLPLSSTSAQFGGGGFAGGQATATTPTAQVAAARLDEEVEFGEVEISVADLDEFLQDKLDEVGVFVDARALETAEVDKTKMIAADIPPMPLRAALRKMLQPLGLQAVIEDEGIAITADFVELTRRGIATEISLRPEADAEILEKLNQSITVVAVDEPLADLIQRLADTTKLKMIVNLRALEEIGLSSEETITASLEDLSLRSALNLMLRDMDLTYMIHDEVIDITTLEAAEQNLIVRIYFLEGIGTSAEDAKSITQVIQSTVVPDTWETLGGPSTIQPFVTGQGNRPCLVIQCTTDVHQRISPLLDGLRRANLRSDSTIGIKSSPPE